MKIAITGKGGVGKTTLSAILSHLFANEGKKVIAVDADPDANLAQALGVPKDETEKLKAIAEMAELIEERTGAKPGTTGGIFKINPKVDDIPEGFGYKINGVTLLVMGKCKVAASGCYCPESALLRRLLIAKDLGVKKVFVIANKVRNDGDISFIKNALSGIEFLGAISFNNNIMETDIQGLPSHKASLQTIEEVLKIKQSLEKLV
ncbi:MAG: AAA family ATPase [Nitrospirae bacterium]|nr:AAA family ATPase [Nitrospirota bacterium]